LWRRAVDLAALEREVGKYAGRTRETVPRYLDQVKKLADAKREAAETCFSIVSTLCPHK
jgi:hypothetical protein